MNAPTLLHIFDHIISRPILLYGSELWVCFNSNSSKVKRGEKDFKIDEGFENLKFCKYTDSY
jgi:hypothetical protein